MTHPTKTRFVVQAIALALLGTLAQGHAQAAGKLKACFMYDSPLREYGWSASHEMGRKAAEKTLPWLTTEMVDNV